MESSVIVTNSGQDQRIGEILNKLSPSGGKVLLDCIVLRVIWVIIFSADLVSDVIARNQQHVNLTKDLLESGHHEVEHGWGCITFIATNRCEDFGGTSAHTVVVRGVRLVERVVVGIRDHTDFEGSNRGSEE